MLWICNDCGEHFEHPDIRKDLDGGDHYIYLNVCPRCHSENIDRYWDQEDPDGSVPVD